MVHSQTGSRIRDRRIEQGIRQAELAALVGISASYLNLIEHNRRRIAGKLLGTIADHLGCSPDALAQGADAALLAQLRVSAAGASEAVELEKAPEFAGRYPGWAQLIAEQARQIDAMKSQLQVLNDRLTYDPQLANSLHEVISSVTAIRSSASILVSGEELDADWQARFHKNVYDDAIRLAQSSETVIKYLEAPKASASNVGSGRDRVDAWLDARAHYISELEANVDTLDAVLADADLSVSEKPMLADRLLVYAADAKLLPYASFAKAAQACSYDPLLIAREVSAPVTVVLRRLASLRVDDGHPAIGLVTCDASGAVSTFKSVVGLTIPKNGAACPLWPLFSAFSRPDQPIRAFVELPGRDADRFLCYAVASGQGAARFDAPPVLRSTMVAIADPPLDAGDPVPVGASCAICPRAKCASRREPSIIAQAQEL